MRLFSFIAIVALSGLTVLGAEPQKKSSAGSSSSSVKTGSYKNVGPAEFEKLRTKGDTNTVVLDVRTPREYAAGHMPNSVNIDYNAPDFEKKVKALDPQKTYLVHCAAGGRSAKACGKLGQLNFGHLYNLEGGMTGWEKAGNKPSR